MIPRTFLLSALARLNKGKKMFKDHTSSMMKYYISMYENTAVRYTYFRIFKQVLLFYIVKLEKNGHRKSRNRLK